MLFLEKLAPYSSPPYVHGLQLLNGRTDYTSLRGGPGWR